MIQILNNKMIFKNKKKIQSQIIYKMIFKNKRIMIQILNNKYNNRIFMIQILNNKMIFKNRIIIIQIKIYKIRIKLKI